MFDNTILHTHSQKDLGLVQKDLGLALSENFSWNMQAYTFITDRAYTKY